jgi:hypothetical protein
LKERVFIGQASSLAIDEGKNIMRPINVMRESRSLKLELIEQALQKKLFLCFEI